MKKRTYALLLALGLLLTTPALAAQDGVYTCVVGARPMPAVVFTDDKGILAQGITEDSARAFAEDIASRAALAGNLRGSAAYRSRLVGVLSRRSLNQLKEMQG